ncbi:hypothetical protein FDECE_7079 [Fusarium decemcellulare]|nr:hypothetical protein FDECE_7079 [Fusarium decemcellulare]
MSYSQRIPAAQWEKQKDRIYAMYVDEDEKLDRVIERMAQEHDFHASRPQYIRRIIVVWKMRKNSTKEEWQLAKSLVRKRKAEGKETRLSMNGKFVDSKKMKKELRRYQEPESACTPPGPQLNTKIITVATMPFFRFQNGFDALISRAFQVPPFNAAAPASDLSPFLVSSCQDTLFRAMPAGLSPVKLLFDGTIPEQTSEWNGRDIQRLIPSEPWMRLFQQLIFMSANNTLAQDQLDEFLQSVIGGGHGIIAALKQIILIDGPTTEIFALRLLHSAIRVEGEESLDFDTAGVKQLLQAGAEPSLSVLHLAIQSDDLETVKVLLEGGADPGFLCDEALFGVEQLLQFERRINEHLLSSDYMDSEELGLLSPIRAATARGNMPIMRVLINGGANTDGFFDPFLYLDNDNLDNENLAKLEGVAQTALQDASQACQVDVVEFLLTMGAHVEATHPLFSTALQQACGLEKWIRDKYRVVETLLDWGADLNAPACQRRGRTALQAAAQSGDFYLVEDLLRRGSEVNAPPAPNGGRTALQAAAESGDIEVVNLLLKNGANPNAEAAMEGGRTCIAASAFSGNTVLLEMMFQLYNDADAREVSENLAQGLEAAITSGSVEQVRRLLDAGAPVNINANVCLCHAIWQTNHEIFDLLMSYGVYPDPIEADPSPLWVAVHQHDEYAVSRLVEAGAALDTLSSHRSCCDDWYGCYGEELESMTGLYDEELPSETPLVAAVMNEDINLVRVLLGAGASPSDVSHSYSPLLLALWGNRGRRPFLDIAQLLLYSGADPHASDWKGNAIHHLLYAQHWDDVHWDDVADHMLRLLLRCNVDVNARSKCGTPLQMLFDDPRCVDMARLLLEAGADVNAPPDGDGSFMRGQVYAPATALQNAAHIGHQGLVNELLAAGADLHAPAFPNVGRTALQAASSSENLGLVEHFVSLGVDVNELPAKDRGATALQIAAVRGNYDIAIFLLERGARINAPTASYLGRTALQGAAEHGRLEMVHIFLENDEEPETLEERCHDAARLAESEGHPVIARILREWKKL